MSFQFTASIKFLFLISGREIQRKFVDEEGDIDYESGIELDGNVQLDLDLDLENNDDDLDLLSDSEDKAGSAEDFQ